MENKKGLLRDWVSSGTPGEQRDAVEKMTFMSSVDDKYGQVAFAGKSENSDIFLYMSNLSAEFSDGLRIGYEETLPFVKHLGERMALALNFFKGISNEELKVVVDCKKKELQNGGRKNEL